MILIQFFLILVLFAIIAGGIWLFLAILGAFSRSLVIGQEWEPGHYGMDADGQATPPDRIWRTDGRPVTEAEARAIVAANDPDNPSPTPPPHLKGQKGGQSARTQPVWER